MGFFLRTGLTLLLLDMRPEEALRLYITLALSVGAHLAAAFILWILPVVSLFPEPDPVEITVIDTAPEPELEEPEVVETAPEPPPPEPEPVVQRTRPEPRPQPTEAEPPPEETPEPAPELEAVEDFSGLTLTNPTGEGWQSNLGNGQAIDGPIGPPNANVTGRRREGIAGGAPGGTGQGAGPAIIAAADLSRQPGPPSARLQPLLESNYPRDARQLGVEGHADVRVHVHADGTVQPLRIVRETHEGFGDACRTTIRRGGAWSPPLDRAGRAVDTHVVFRCTFTIRF